MPKTPNIDIIGIKNKCILIVNPNTHIKTIFDELTALLTKHKNFFHGSSLGIDLKTRVINVRDSEELVSQIKDRFNIGIDSVFSQNQETRKTFANLGINTFPEVNHNEGDSLNRMKTDKRTSNSYLMKNPVKSTLFNTKLIYSTLRSGQALESKGNLVIVGDINPGAEVIAKGDIIVFGSLRGMAHAGAPDNNDAKIIALHLCPTLLKIGNSIASAPPDADCKKVYKPEIASIEKNQIVIEDLL